MKQNIYASQTLEKSFTQIGDYGVSKLGQELLKFKNLRSLTFFLLDNQISDDGIFNLGSGIALCKNLNNILLSLSNNLIGDYGTAILGCCLSQCVNLKILILDLRSNEISNFVIPGLADLVKCPYLISLTLLLSFNQIKKKSGLSLKKRLIKSKRLTYLDYEY